MFAGMDVVGVDIAPERNDFSANSIFFIMWMIVGSFVALNLFVGTRARRGIAPLLSFSSPLVCFPPHASPSRLCSSPRSSPLPIPLPLFTPLPLPPLAGAIVDNFTRIKKESEGSATMTPEQQQWVMTMKSANSNPDKGAREPSWGPRKAAFRLIMSKPFEFGVMGVIAVNIAGMAMDYHHIELDVEYYARYKSFMLFFSYFYYCECILKVFAMGCRYFQVSRVEEDHASTRASQEPHKSLTSHRTSPTNYILTTARLPPPAMCVHRTPGVSSTSSSCACRSSTSSSLSC